MKDKQVTTMVLPRDLHLAAKVKAVKERRPLSEVISELLREWIEEPPDDGKES